MFDFPQPNPQGDAALVAVRHFFCSYGHELAEAARLLGGDAAKARAVSCGARLATTGSVGARTRRDLEVLHRLLRLEDAGHPDRIETALSAALHPASREVERICFLTDRIAELLRALEDVGAGSAAPGTSSDGR